MRSKMYKSLIATLVLMSQLTHAYQDNSTINAEEVNRFATVMAQIKYFYIEDKEFSNLFDNAISGMMKGLDPHSAYISLISFLRFQYTVVWFIRQIWDDEPDKVVRSR